MKVYDLKCDCDLCIRVTADSNEHAARIISNAGWKLKQDSKSIQDLFVEYCKMQEDNHIVVMPAWCEKHNPDKESNVQWAVRLRFRNYEDGMSFIGGEKVNVDKIVYPYQKLPNGDVVINREWESSPWELDFSIRPSRKLEYAALT